FSCGVGFCCRRGRFFACVDHCRAADVTATSSPSHTLPPPTAQSRVYSNFSASPETSGSNSMSALKLLDRTWDQVIEEDVLINSSRKIEWFPISFCNLVEECDMLYPQSCAQMPRPWIILSFGDDLARRRSWFAEDHVGHGRTELCDNEVRIINADA